MTKDEAAQLKKGDRVRVNLVGMEEQPATVTGFDPYGHVLVAVEFPALPIQLQPFD